MSSFATEMQAVGKMVVEFAGSSWWMDDGKIMQAPLNSDGTIDFANAGECDNCSSQMLDALISFLSVAENEMAWW